MLCVCVCIRERARETKREDEHIKLILSKPFRYFVRSKSEKNVWTINIWAFGVKYPNQEMSNWSLE